jgi:thiosulfate reductase/polysulfide reductase chain A
MHNTQVQEFADAVGNGASVIVVDPRFSIAASKAKYYLPIKPGTDLALILAWMNVLVREGLYDRKYVTAHGYGFDQFAVLIDTCTPEWAYPETGIEPDLIRVTAREMHDTARHAGIPGATSHAGRRRAAQQGNSGPSMLCWGTGGQGDSNSGQHGRPAIPIPVSDPCKVKVDNPDHRYPFAHDHHDRNAEATL